MIESSEEYKNFCERVERHLTEQDKALLALQMAEKVQDNEISSLRASRHEHGNWLNRHNLEIQGLQLENSRFDNNLNTVFNRLEAIDLHIKGQEIKIVTLIAELKENFTAQINTLRSDQRQTTWIVGLIVCIIVFVAKSLTPKLLGF